MQHNGGVQIRQMDCLYNECIHKKTNAQYPLVRLLTFGLLQNRLRLKNDSAVARLSQLLAGYIFGWYLLVFIDVLSIFLLIQI